MAKEPTIREVIRSKGDSYYPGDPHVMSLRFVHARLSDGRVVHIFTSKPGDVDVKDAQLIDCTVEQAKALADERGTVL